MNRRRCGSTHDWIFQYTNSNVNLYKHVAMKMGLPSSSAFDRRRRTCWMPTACGCAARSWVPPPAPPSGSPCRPRPRPAGRKPPATSHWSLLTSGQYANYDNIMLIYVMFIMTYCLSNLTNCLVRNAARLDQTLPGSKNFSWSMIRWFPFLYLMRAFDWAILFNSSLICKTSSLICLRDCRIKTHHKAAT